MRTEEYRNRRDFTDAEHEKHRQQATELARQGRDMTSIKYDYLEGKITHEEATKRLFEYAWHIDAVDSNNKCLRLWKEMKEKLQVNA